MATYFDGSNSEIQSAGGGDGLQTLILMNPTGYLGFSDTIQPPQPAGSNFVFLNSNTPGGGGGGNSSFNLLLPNAPTTSSQPQQLLGIPLASASTSSQDHSQYAFLPRTAQYNVYSQKVDHVVARETPRATQGLSLSLSSQLPGAAYGAKRELPPPQNVSVSAGGGDGGACYSSSSVISNGLNGGMQNVMLSSKYLKAAQELLDEVVKVGKGVKSCGSAKRDDGQAKNVDQDQPLSEIAGGGGEGGSGWENGGKRGGELTTAERQEIQMKKAKLVSMLDEVEQRYRQYHHQMQSVTTIFEQAGGIGSAKAYTALALQTISKQFRSLKDAILGQVRVASKSLGEEEEEGLGGKIKMNGSRMKYVDNQLRQQRALQQLGMVQHNAWRPQRGLPERSVSVLRAWLFEHFLHPYPKDSDKIMLAKQTGLTRSQVSNWFINARVRLWKPMVEEMYTEEIKGKEKNGSEEKSGKSEQNEDSATKTTTPPEKASTMENQNKGYVLNQDLPNMHNQSGFNLIGSPEMESNTHESPKKRRASDVFHSPTGVPSVSTDTKLVDSDNEHISMKFDTERQSRDGFSLLGGSTNFIEGGFSSYPIAELGRFNADQQFPTPYSGNGVSLTLGLPHCENLAMNGPHQTFLPNQNIELARGVEIGEAHDYGSIEHRVTLPEYMRESTFRTTRGLLHDYYHTL